MEKEIIETQNKIQQLIELRKEIEELNRLQYEIQACVKEELNKIRTNKIEEIIIEYEKSNLREREIRDKHNNRLDNDSLEEINKISQYINYYLDSLLVSICKLYGHAVRGNPNARSFGCECCVRYFDLNEHIRAHRMAKYINIIDDSIYDHFCYEYEPKYEPKIIVEESSLPLVLASKVMTFEEFKELTEDQVQSLFKQLDIEEINREKDKCNEDFGRSLRIIHINRSFKKIDEEFKKRILSRRNKNDSSY